MRKYFLRHYPTVKCTKLFFLYKSGLEFFAVHFKNMFNYNQLQSICRLFILNRTLHIIKFFELNSNITVLTIHAWSKIEDVLLLHIWHLAGFQNPWPLRLFNCISQNIFWCAYAHSEVDLHTQTRVLVFENIQLNIENCI